MLDSGKGCFAYITVATCGGCTWAVDGYGKLFLGEKAPAKCGKGCRFLKFWAAVVIKEVDKDAFNATGLADLEEIYLDNRDFETLPSNLFQGLTGLRVVTIAGNKRLKVLPANLFRGARSLVYLDLRNNTLTSLPAGLFQGVRMIHGSLFLSGNRLTSFPPGIFSEVGPLNDFGASGNNFTSLPGDIFSGEFFSDSFVERFLTAHDFYWYSDLSEHRRYMSIWTYSIDNLERFFQIDLGGQLGNRDFIMSLASPRAMPPSKWKCVPDIPSRYFGLELKWDGKSHVPAVNMMKKRRFYRLYFGVEIINSTEWFPTTTPMCEVSSRSSIPEAPPPFATTTFCSTEASSGYRGWNASPEQQNH